MIPTGDDDAGATASGESTPRGEDVVRLIRPIRVFSDGTAPIRDQCEVVAEVPMTVAVEGAEPVTLMCTPTDIGALSVGFVFSEGLIATMEDVRALSVERDPLTVHMRLARGGHGATSHGFVRASSSGLMGRPSVDLALKGELACEDSLRVSSAVPAQMGRTLFEAQSLFRRTGGTHAAMIYTPAGDVLGFGEDIGRHNALDKAVGKCLMQGILPRGCGVMLSGRVSLELVAKAARAGIELITAVSAPSSLAVEAADQCNLTLCGFVRDTRATVYTHPRRITNAGGL